jgi:hypothetical protein
MLGRFSIAHNWGEPMSLIAIAMLAAAAALPPGQYSNEEEVYFAKEAGKAPPPWLAVTVDAGGWHAVDAFGSPVAAPKALSLTSDPNGLAATLPDGTRTLLRKGRPATCWVAARKNEKKADGSDDYAFTGNLKLHDQGGRARAGGNGAAEVVIRMRNVVWPSGANRPSLVLYVHKPDNPDHAEAYAWADLKAARVGVNLRWVQASCTIDGLDAPAASSKGS